MMRILASMLALMYLSCCVGMANAQGLPSISVDTDADEVFIGESLTLRISLNNMKEVAAPKLDSLQNDFTTELIAERPVNQSSTTIINGRVMQRNLYRIDFDYQLTPKRQGTLTIPSISVEFEGKQYRSEPMEIRVLEPAPQDYVFLETHVSKARVYPTEKFDVTLRVLVRGIPDWEGDPVRPLARRPPQLSIPWVETPDGLKGPDQNQWLQTFLSDRNYGFTINRIRTSGAFLFDGPQFALFDLLTSKTEKKVEDGGEHEYFVYEITKSMRADKPGRYAFGPAMVKGTFAIGRENDRLLAKQIAATASPVEIEVSEIPSPRPKDYFGGIGDYTLRTTLAPSKCRVGDPVSLTLTIESKESSLEPVFAPKLSNVPFVTDSFEIIDDAPIGQKDGNKKVFVYSLRPKKEIDAIPPFVFQTFDPNSETFKDVTSNPMSMDIEQGAAITLTPLPLSEDTAEREVYSTSVDITLGTTLSHPVVGDWMGSKYWGAAALMSWLGSLGIFIGFRVRKSSRNRREKRKGALEPLIEKRMQEAVVAIQSGQVDWACKRIHQSLAEIVASPMKDEIAGMTARDILECAKARGVGVELMSALQNFLAKLDARRFGSDIAVDDSSLFIMAADLQKSLLEHVSPRRVNSNRRFPFGRWVALCFVFLAMGGSSAIAGPHQASWNSLIEQLAQARLPDEFRKVALEMEGLCREGEPNANAYFHQGNAWFRAGEFGRAIHAYCIAQRVAPGDEIIQSNLKIARESALSKRGPIASASEIEKRFRIPMTWYGERTLAAVVCILSGPLLVWSCLSWRWGLGLASIGLVLLGFCLGLHAWIESPDRFSRSHGVVIRETKLYEGMSDRTNEIGGSPIREGVEFQVLKQTPSWILGRFPERGEGWVRSQFVRTGR